MTPARSLLSVALCAFAIALAGCGGSDQTSSTSPGAATAPPAVTGKSEPAQRDPDRAKAGGSGTSSGGGEPSGSAGDRSGSSPASVAPLRVSGGGSAQFEVQGGDNSIQGYGTEAGKAELLEAAEAVHSFFVFRARGEWRRACDLLSQAQVESLAELTADLPEMAGKGCPFTLAGLNKQLSPSRARRLTAVDAAALRTDGEQSFLIYEGPPGRTVYAMPLRQEGGAWKLSATAGTPLPGV